MNLVSKKFERFFSKNSNNVADKTNTAPFEISVISFCKISNNDVVKARNGYELVELVLTVKNTTGNEIKFRPSDFKAKLDGSVINENEECRIISSNNALTGILQSQQEATGSLCYEVPDTWYQLEVKTLLGGEFSISEKIVITNQTL